jgi:TonB family protein
MKPNDANEPGVFSGTTVSDSSSWIGSLARQLRELREERKNPPAKVEITAEKDPAALQKLVETPSPITSLLASVKELLNDRRNPHKIEMTAAPVEVQDIWTEHHVRLPVALSAVGQGLVVVLIIAAPWAAAIKAPPPAVTEVTLFTPPPPPIVMPKLPDKSGGGGGGGNHAPTPPSFGRLPKASTMQLVPPTPEVKNMAPVLVAEPTIIAPQLMNMPQMSSLLPLGDPDGVVGPPSAGPGSGGGIGTGKGGGVGSGNGPGVGPGSGGGIGGGVYRLGSTGGITEPTIIYRVEPQYSEDARKARYQGTVTLEAIVHKDGTVEIIRVVRGVGFGLDENAQKALRQWKFKPAMLNGQPVDVSLNIEVNFNLR